MLKFANPKGKCWFWFSAEKMVTIPPISPFSVAALLNMLSLFSWHDEKSKLNRNLIIDENVNILVPVSSNQSYLTIHKDAILKREGLSFAYVVKEKKVEIRPLRLGEAVGNRFIVLSGVKENDIAVIKGNERLRPGQIVSVKWIEAISEYN